VEEDVIQRRVVVGRRLEWWGLVQAQQYVCVLECIRSSTAVHRPILRQVLAGDACLRQLFVLLLRFMVRLERFLRITQVSGRCFGMPSSSTAIGTILTALVQPRSPAWCTTSKPVIGMVNSR